MVPPLQVGHQALGSKSPDIGRKWDEIWVKTFFLLFTWFWAKNMTKFEWSLFFFFCFQKWDEIWVKTFFFLLFTWFWAKNGTKFEWRPFSCSSPDFGRKMGRNLSEDLFFLLFTWFWAKDRTKFEGDNFKFWSMFLSNFLKFPAPPFQNPAYATGFEAKEKGLEFRGQGVQNVSLRTSSRPRTSSRTPPMVLKALL